MLYDLTSMWNLVEKELRLVVIRSGGWGKGKLEEGGEKVQISRNMIK